MSLDNTKACKAETAGFLRIAPYDFYRCFENINKNTSDAINKDISYKTLYQY